MAKHQLRSLSDLRACPRNPRTISPEALAGLQTSIAEFGDISGLVWNRRTGQLVAGHQRLEALKRKFGRALKLSADALTLPTGLRFPIRIVDWPDDKAAAAMLAANNQHIAGDWTEGLAALLAELPEDLGDLFKDLELDKLLQDIPMTDELQEGLTDPDAIPDPPDAATTQPGDLWSLGSHRLLCGDAGNPEHLDRLVAGAAIDLINTDPPYNVKVEPRSHNAVAAARASGNKTTFHHQAMDEAIHGKSHATHKKLRPKDRPLENDFLSDEDFQKLLDAWFGNAARVLKPGGSFSIWGGYTNIGNYPPPLKRAGLYFSQGVVWDKEHPVLTRKDMLGAFELCFYGWKQGAGHHWYGPNNVQDIWHVKKVTQSKMVHLTEKPVELSVRPMQYSSRSGESVLDLFAGSGSTLIAAEQTGRRIFLMELDALYCDVIVQRWEEFTGKKAKRRKK